MSPSPRPIVLFVEDEPLIRMLSGRALVRLLFTDVNMPGRPNGIALAEQAKADSPALKVIITFALPLLRSVEHLTATFVAKPYDPCAVSRTGRPLLAA